MTHDLEPPGTDGYRAPCARCGLEVDSRRPESVRLTLHRQAHDEDPWPVPWTGNPVEDAVWETGMVRAFCTIAHAREWMRAGSPRTDEWESPQPPPPETAAERWGCRAGATLGCLVVLLLAAFVVLGAAEAWRLVF